MSNKLFIEDKHRIPYFIMYISLFISSFYGQYFHKNFPLFPSFVASAFGALMMSVISYVFLLRGHVVVAAILTALICVQTLSTILSEQVVSGLSIAGVFSLLGLGVTALFPSFSTNVKAYFDAFIRRSNKK